MNTSRIELKGILIAFGLSLGSLSEDYEWHCYTMQSFDWVLMGKAGPHFK